MTLKTKKASVEIKSLDLQTGEFLGWANVFDLVDYANEMTTTNTFVKTLADWGQKGHLPPLLFDHDQAAVVGKFLEMEIKPEGLFVKGTISEPWLLDKVRNEEIFGLSVGYITTEFHMNGDVCVLDEVELLETSIVSCPCNDQSLIIAVKSVQVEDETQVEEEQETQAEIEEKEIETEQEPVQEEIKTGITNNDIKLASFLIKRNRKKRA